MPTELQETGLYSGELIDVRFFASDIWEAYFRVRLFSVEGLIIGTLRY